MTANNTITKKFINKLDDAANECIKGISFLYPHLTVHHKQGLVTTSNEIKETNNVAILSGGGSGHEPFATGYVGKGMLTAAVAGGIYTSPSAGNIYYAIKQLHKTYKGGVFVIIPNYTGDRLNFGMAIEKAKNNGMKVESIIFGEDFASSNNTGAGSRGMCGLSIIYKLCGSLAENGAGITEMQQIAQKVLDNISTYGACLYACSLPGQPPLFEVAPDELELGIGVHGEAGVTKMKMCTSKELVNRILSDLVEKLNLNKVTKVVVAINNLGATSHMEINILCYDVVKFFEKKSISVERIYAGPIMTSLDMAGMQICVLKLPTDKESTWLNLLDQSTEAPAWMGKYFSIPNGKKAMISEDNIDENDKLYINGPKLNENQCDIFRKCLLAISEAFLVEEVKLNKLDAGCGDGDCGSTLKKLAIAIKDHVKRNELSNPARTFYQLSEFAETTMGGTSGAIYSLGLTAMARTLNESNKLTREVWIQSWKNAVNSISKYGGASVGDRSLIDALWPASDAFEQNSKIELKQALELSLNAATDGYKRTADIKARVGRASYVGECHLGGGDAGAYGIVCLIKAIVQSIN